jgi:hypothetical protein
LYTNNLAHSISIATFANCILVSESEREGKRGKERGIMR